MIADGKGYFSEGHKTAFYPIGYPAFLSALFFVFGKSVLVARIANIILSISSIWLVYKLSRVFVKNAGLRLVVVFIFAFYPNHIAYTTLLYNETFFTTLFLAALYFQIRFMNRGNVKYLVLSAVLYGLAVLVRPAVLFVPIIVFAVAYFKRQKHGIKRYDVKWIKHIGFSYLLILLLLLPWQIRNYKVFDSFVFISTTAGFDLLVGNHPGAKGNYEPDTTYFSQIDRSGTEVDYDKRTKLLVKEIIKNNPKAFFKRLPHKLYYFLWPGMDGISWNMQTDSVTELLFLKRFRFLSNAYYLFLLILLSASILFSILYWRMSSYWFWLVLSLSGYYILVSLAFFGESRFHFHLVPLAILFLAERIEVIFTKRKSI